MKFEIRGRDIYVTKTLRSHIERHLHFALGRFAERIRRVRVSLGDLNGPKGGVDKSCRLDISVAPSTTMVIEDRDSSLYVAIARVADKAGRCVGRRLKQPRGGSESIRMSESLG